MLLSSALPWYIPEPTDPFDVETLILARELTDARKAFAAQHGVPVWETTARVVGGQIEVRHDPPAGKERA